MGKLTGQRHRQVGLVGETTNELALELVIVMTQAGGPVEASEPATQGALLAPDCNQLVGVGTDVVNEGSNQGLKEVGRQAFKARELGNLFFTLEDRCCEMEQGTVQPAAGTISPGAEPSRLTAASAVGNDATDTLLLLGRAGSQLARLRGLKSLQGRHTDLRCSNIDRGSNRGSNRGSSKARAVRW